MVLNNLTQQFSIYFGKNFFYPEVSERWNPVIRRQLLPYLNLEDYMMAQIQSVSMPQVAMPSVTQQFGHYQVSKRNAKAVDEVMQKSATITFKMTEGYTSYFIWREQLDLFFQMFKKRDLYMSPIMVDLLDDQGRSVVTYGEVQITPENLSDIDLSYAMKLGSYNTFTLQYKYNYFDIWYLEPVSGKMIYQTEK